MSIQKSWSELLTMARACKIVVDTIDLLHLQILWGPCPAAADDCPGDLDCDGQVGVLDVVPSEPIPGGTLFNRLGDLPFWGAIVLGILGSLIAARRPRRIA